MQKLSIPLALLALTLAGCGTNQIDGKANSAQPDVSTSTAAASTTTPVNTRDEYGDLQFLLTIREFGIVGSDEVMVQVAKDICTGVGRAEVANSRELIALLRENLVPGMDIYDALTVATPGIMHYCPEYSAALEPAN